LRVWKTKKTILDRSKEGTFRIQSRVLLGDSRVRKHTGSPRRNTA
jgi:hypothetical protein